MIIERAMPLGGANVTIDGVTVEDELNLISGFMSDDKLEIITPYYPYGLGTIYKDGIVYTGFYGNVNYSITYNLFYKYEQHSWTRLVDLPISTYHEYARIVLFNNEIHLFYNSKLYKYNGDSWTEIVTINAASPAFLFERNGELHIVSGCESDRGTKGYYYKWDGETLTYICRTPQSWNRLYFACFYNNDLYFATTASTNPYQKFNGTGFVAVSSMPFMYYGYTKSIEHQNILYYLSDAKCIKYDGANEKIIYADGSSLRVMDIFIVGDEIWAMMEQGVNSDVTSRLKLIDKKIYYNNDMEVLR